MACRYTYKDKTYDEDTFKGRLEATAKVNPNKAKEVWKDKEILYGSKDDVVERVKDMSMSYGMGTDGWVRGNAIENIKDYIIGYDLDKNGVVTKYSDKMGALAVYVDGKRYYPKMETDVSKVGKVYLQKDTYEYQHEASVATISSVAERLSKIYGIKYKMVDASTMKKMFGTPAKGAYSVKDDTVYLNEDRMTPETPYHEYGHIFIETIKQKNRKVYDNIVSNLDMNSRTAKRIKESYPITEKFTLENQTDEIIVELLGVYANMNSEQRKKTLLGRLIDTILQFMKDHFGMGNKKINIENIDDNISLWELSKVIGSDMLVVNSIKPDKDALQRGEGVFVSDLLSTNNDMWYYEDRLSGDMFNRLSSVIAMMSENGLYDYATSVIDKKWGNKDKEGVVDMLDSNGVVIGTTTYTNELNKLKESLKMRQQRGRAHHKYMEYLIALKNKENSSEIYQQFLNENVYNRTNGEIITFFDVSDSEKGFITKNRLNEFFNDIVSQFVGRTDEVYSEVTHSLALPEFEVTVNGKVYKLKGIAGTSDMIVDHGDNTVSIFDYKTGSLDNKSLGELLERYARNFKLTPKISAVIKIVFNAVLLRAKDRSKKIQDIRLFHYTEEKGGDNSIDVWNDSFGFKEALQIIERYFEKDHNEFWKKNKDLWQVGEYAASSAPMDAVLKNKDKKISNREAFITTTNNLMAELREFTEARVELSAKGEELAPEDQQRYLKLIETIEAHFLGSKDGVSLKSKMIERVNTMEALVSNMYDRTSPITQLLGKMAQESFLLYISEKLKAWDAYDNRIDFIRKRQKRDLLQVGAKYKEDFAFMWTQDKDDDGWYMTTWKSDTWKDMSKEEKSFANYHRWDIRYQLFSTLKPEEGIYHIEKELKERTDLSESDKNYLNNQITELKKIPFYDKMKSSGLSGFGYYEGWTPRVQKSSEEAKTFAERIKEAVKTSIFVTQEELLAQARDENSLHYSGLPVRFMGRNADSAQLQETDYTWNVQSIFMNFSDTMTRKRSFDNTYNYFTGVKVYLNNIDSIKGTDAYKKTIDLLTGHMKAAMELQRVHNFQGRGITKKDAEGNVIGKYTIDNILKANKVYWGITLQALNIVGGIRTSLTQIIRTFNRGIAGTFASVLGKVAGVKKVDYRTFDVFKALGVVTNMLKDLTWGTAKNNKLYQMIRKFDFLISKQDFDLRTSEKLKTGVGFFLSKHINTNLLYATYRLGDTYALSMVLYPMLKNMKIDVNGKLVSMWDLYDVVDGELVYTGPVRGVDSITYQEIKELTADEISVMKNVSRKLTGNMREDEKTMADLSTIGAIAMQFKHFFWATFESAWGGEKNTRNLGSYMANDWYEIIEEKHERYGERIRAYETKTVNGRSEKVKTEEFIKLEKEKIDGKFISMLPVLEWQNTQDQGYMRAAGGILLTALRGSIFARLITKNPKSFREEWNKMSDNQKQNVFFAMSQFMSYFTLIGLIALVFGDADDDDTTDPWKMQMITMVDDTMFETLMIDPLSFYESVISVPSLKQTFTMAESTMIFVNSMATGDELKSGKSKGSYRGQRQFWKGIIGARTVVTNYELIMSWDAFMENLTNPKGTIFGGEKQSEIDIGRR